MSSNGRKCFLIEREAWKRAPIYVALGRVQVLERELPEKPLKFLHRR